MERHALQRVDGRPPITAGTGLPQTPVYLAPVQGTGVTGSIRPDYTGAPLYAAPPGLSLNPAAYTAPPPGNGEMPDEIPSPVPASSL